MEKKIENICRCLNSLNLCSCGTRAVFDRIANTDDSYFRSIAYVKIMKHVTENDIGLTNEERGAFMKASLDILDFVKEIRKCKSTDPADCACQCNYSCTLV